MTHRQENWMISTWRPLMAYCYIAICLFDFIIGPILTMFYFGYVGGSLVQWQPITLVESGLFHVAMGAVLGVSAFTRGQEKLEAMKTEKKED